MAEGAAPQSVHDDEQDPDVMGGDDPKGSDDVMGNDDSPEGDEVLEPGGPTPSD